MLLKKPALAYSSANHLSSLTSNTPTTPQPCPFTTLRSSQHRKSQTHRTYTTAHDSPTPHPDPSTSTRSTSRPTPDPAHLPWPTPTNPTPPTPYAIFSQSPSEPYSKRRFYELVKLYHPDLNKHTTTTHPLHSISTTELTNRYRLVIAANAILSDPHKRDAYDRYGAGWLGELESLGYGYSSGSSGQGGMGAGAYKYGHTHRWRTGGAGAGTGSYAWPIDQDPMYNATWEDWEAWYRRELLRRRGYKKPSRSQRWANFFSGEAEPNATTNTSARQAPVYANNYAFISIVFLLAALGGAGQATRANEGAKNAVSRASLVNDENSKLLMQARQNTREQGAGTGNGGGGAVGTGGGGREGKERRIKRFLQSEGEFDARVLREGDQGLCAPGMVKERGEPRFWEKPPENR